MNDPTEAPRHGLQCAWTTTAGHRCLLTGSTSFSTDGKGKWYCTWHAHCLNDPESAESFDIFKPWREEFIQRHTSEFWRQSPQHLFYALIGRGANGLKSYPQVEGEKAGSNRQKVTP